MQTGRKGEIWGPQICGRRTHTLATIFSMKPTKSDIAQMLKLSDREFKITMINILHTLMEKVDNVQDEMANFSREKKTIKKNQMEMLEINTVIQIKIYFDWLSNELNTVEKLVTLNVGKQKLPN